VVKRALLVAGFLSTAHLQAADRPLPALPSTVGVTISLTTSGYEFPAVSGSIPLAISKGVQAFPASVSLYNHTRKDIAFAFPSPEAAANPFLFQVSDSAGNVLWQSNDGGSVPLMTDGTLHRRSGWKYTALVPLAISGSALQPGTYTLDVTVAGAPVFGATTSFQVTQPAPKGGQGEIDGSLVGGGTASSSVALGSGLIANAHPTGIVAAPRAASGDIANVPIKIVGPLSPSDTSKVADAFNWEIKANNTAIATVTDSAGKFRVTLAPGRYFVSVEEQYPGALPNFVMAGWSGPITMLGQFVTVKPSQTKTVAIDVWSNWYPMFWVPNPSYKGPPNPILIPSPGF
jgi:hypothetical protein